MAIYYIRMWKLPVDQKMSNADFCKAADITSNTMIILCRDGEVNLAILDRIFKTQDSAFGDIMSYVPDGEGGMCL